MNLGHRAVTNAPQRGNTNAVELPSPQNYLRMVILAPPQARIPLDFQTVHCQAQAHASLLAEMQRMRGTIYLEDGAIQAHQLTADGLFCQPIDRSSWHLLTLTRSGKICGCVRYYSHSNFISFQDLWVKNSAIASSPEWGRIFRASVEQDLCKARQRNVSFVEVGGWAIAPEQRCSPEALRSALATYSLARLLGGCIGITTATVRHCSASILRRIGGASLESPKGELPPYFDPRYNCKMEVLRFESAHPAERFAGLVDQLCSEIVNVPVVCETLLRRSWSMQPVHAHVALAERNVGSGYAR